MRLISRTILREILTASLVGAVLFTFVIFLEESRPLFGFLVRNSGTPSTVAYLFALVLPQALPWTIPLSVLIGTLLTLSRMSSDGEITAMRAAGVPGRRVVPAIVAFGFFGMLVAASATLWLTPWSQRELIRVENVVSARQLTADVQPRMFEEQFPNTVLYVGDISATSGRWRRVFMADVTPPEERKPSSADRGDTPRIMLAFDALAVADATRNRVLLDLHNGSTYEPDKESNYQISAAPTGEQALDAQTKEEHNSHPSTEMDTLPLYRHTYRNPSPDRSRALDERIELHKRLALPLACILMSLAAVPLGITSRRAGKSGAVVLTVAIALVYYTGLISCISLARQGTLRPEIAVWLPNIVLAVFAIIMITRLEVPGDRDVLGTIIAFFRSFRRERQERRTRASDRFGPRVWVSRFALLPEVVDTYILTSFLFYFFLLLVTFVVVFHVFTFFSLLSDIFKNHPPMSHVLSYHLFLTPRLIYEMTPLAVLAAVLVCFGVLTKHNEVTAFKACGISLYRLSVPVLIAGLLLSGGLFLFDHTLVPEWDRRQDALRNEIKGKAPATYLRPDRKWVYVREHERVYYYKYFDPKELTMVGVNVFEIDPVTYRLKRHILAQRARWETSLNGWVFENGRSWDIATNLTPASSAPHFDNFMGGTHTFPELEESPDYFVHEVKQSRQMNFQELQKYIDELQRSGLDTIPLQVALQKKFSVPLFALIMAMVSIPFAFLTGNRGAMAGVGLSLGIAIAYFSVQQLFEQVGNLNQLPPQVAAWSPDVVFSLAGLYFLARMRT
jgi:LPS export ABC transporter permease LptF/LPS export ABC transporter permease LptG